MDMMIAPIHHRACRCPVFTAKKKPRRGRRGFMGFRLRGTMMGGGTHRAAAVPSFRNCERVHFAAGQNRGGGTMRGGPVPACGIRLSLGERSE
jgi:hypothetical protein